MIVAIIIVSLALAWLGYETNGLTIRLSTGNMMPNSYMLYGIVLTVVGVIMVLASFALHRVFFSAIGPSAIILGFTGITLSDSRFRMPQEARQTLPKLIASLVIAFGIINASLALFGQNSIDVYFIITAIIFLITAWIYLCFNPRARSALTAIGTGILAVFILIIAFKVIEIMK